MAFGALAAGALAYKNPSATKNLLTGGAYGTQQALKKAQQELTEMQRLGTEKRLANLNTMQAPVISDSTQARIAALKADAQVVPLSQNAYFQGDRANLVQNARQEVGGLANRQNAYGVRGGFSSIQGGAGGSIQDQYDRLSGQLSGLGQQARERQYKAGADAQTLEQEQADKQIEFQNQQALLRDAIYRGDLETASELYQSMLTQRNKANSALYTRTGDIIKNVGTKAFTGGAF